MPIYEYFCPNCNGRFQKLVRGFSDPADLACPRCAGTEVQRAVSRVAVLKSEESRADALADPSMFAGAGVPIEPRNQRLKRATTSLRIRRPAMKRGG